jgi:2-hydroxy-3-oxopropionate reductase
MSSSIKTVGFIGTGLMGLPMAKNILSKRFKLNVWNRTPDKTLELQKKGAKVFKDIKDLVQNSKVIVSMLANDDVCKAILIKKIQPYLKKGQIVIDMSSTTQNTALEIGKALKKKKASFLDAPVSGGTIGAEKGTLAIMVGGEKKIFNNVMLLFKSMGTAIYVGKTGCGQVAKLANQTIVGISIGAVSEALILAEAAGADPKAVREIMLHGFAGCLLYTSPSPRDES